MSDTDCRANAVLAVELDDADWSWFVPRPQRCADVQLAAAILLAPRIEICEALLAGVPVPAERIDRTLARRLDLRGDVELDARLSLRVVALGPLPPVRQLRAAV